MNDTSGTRPVTVDWSEGSIPPHWLVSGGLLLVVSLAVVGFYWATVLSLLDAWGSSRTYAHGYLVIPAAGYLVWCYRERLFTIVPRANVWGLLSLLMVEGLWIVGKMFSLVALQQAAIVCVFPCLVLTILGQEVARTVSWPMGFLLFMLPYGTSIEPWLQAWTAAVIVGGLSVLGIPHRYDTFQITVPSGIWEVAPDCGGLRYLLPGLALGYAFSILAYRSPWRRAGFLILCGTMLMLANGLRAFAVILGDHLGIAVGTDHRVFSYSVYGMTIPLLYWIGNKWVDGGIDGAPPRRSASGCGQYEFGKAVMAAMAAVAVLAVAPSVAWWWADRP